MDNENWKMQDAATDAVKSANDTAKKAGETGQEAMKAAQDSLNTVKDSIVHVMDQNRSAVQKMARAMRDVSMQFVNARLEHTGQIFERGRACRDISELVVLQHDWLMDIARDYADMTKNLAEALQESSQPGQNAEHTPSQTGGDHRVAA